jgi:methionine aminotransferase
MNKKNIKPCLKSKLPGVGTTIFTVMSRLAQQHGAINLSQGFPDFDGPPLMRERAAWHMAHGHNQYAPLAGVPDLLEAIADKVDALYGAKPDPATEICVTPGATEALSTAIAATIHPGDEAIIIDPAYDCYDPCVVLNGGVPVHVPMDADFRIDWERVRLACTERTRLLIVNSPHNPTGSAFSVEDIAALRGLLDDFPIMVLSDEVYEHIVFDEHEHLGLLRYPDLRARSFVVSSFGKTYHATGWRLGYCIAPAAEMAEFLRIHQFTNFSANAPLQYALADVMRELPGHATGLGAFYERKRDLFVELLGSTPMRCLPSAGTYFQLADYSAVSDMPDTEFAEWLTREIGVAAIPLSVFYREPPNARWVRFCFAKDDDTLRAAAERLGRI